MRNIGSLVIGVYLIVVGVREESAPTWLRLLNLYSGALNLIAATTT